MICDTSFLIDLMRYKPAAVAKASELDAKGVSLAITSVTLFEIWRGLHRASAEKKENVAKRLSGMRLLLLDGAAAMAGAEVDIELRAKGAEIELTDSMIAGIAIKNEETVLTGNVKHFSRIKGLKVEGY